MKNNSFRTVGEFERQESVLIICPLAPYATKELYIDGVSLEIVENLIDHVKCIICCYDETVKSRAMGLIKESNLDLNKIEFTIFPAPIVYPRDFGAEIMLDSQGNKALVDFDFDMYGYCTKNDPLSRTLEKFDKFHANLIGDTDKIFTRLIGEGGDREFNGDGILMTIEETEVTKRNPGMTKNEVENELKRLFNLEKIIWIPKCTYDDDLSYEGPIPSSSGEYTSYRAATANGHIDEMCRFVDKNTILIANISDEEAKKSKLHALNKKRLDLAYNVLINETNASGEPFNIIKMPSPEPLYVDITPDDDCYCNWDQARFEFGDKLLDGSDFPTGKMNVLPAMSYCNFLIANGIVIAQKYYKDGMPLDIKIKDDEALYILKSVFPDRKVVAVDVLPLNLYGGGVHCHTRNVPCL